MRIEAKRNAVFPMCIKHADDWKPLECSQQNRSQEYIKKFVRVFDYQWFKVKIRVFVDFPEKEKLQVVMVCFSCSGPAVDTKVWVGRRSLLDSNKLVGPVAIFVMIS